MSDRGRSGAVLDRPQPRSRPAAAKPQPSKCRRSTAGPPPRRGPHARWGLGLILALYLALAVGYNIATPVGLAPDEGGHAQYISWLAARHRFPRFGLGRPGDCYEGHQAPLYYLLSAPLWAAAGGTADHGRLSLAPWRSHPKIWVLSGRAITPARAVRLFSTLIGAMGLVLLWTLVGVLFPEDGWLQLGATAFAAFLPMNLALSAAISNDILIETLFTASLLAMVLLIRRGYRHRRAFALGAAVGLAILAKSTGMLLILPALLTLLAVSGRPGLGRSARTLDLSLFCGGCLRTFGMAAVLAGPWLLRNRILYGDLLAARAFAAFFTSTQGTPAAMMARAGWTVSDYLSRIAIPWTYGSFWGVFGPFMVWMDSRVYHALIVPSVLAPVGAALYFWRARGRLDPAQRAICRILALSLVLVAYGYLRYNLLLVEPQSRFLLAAMAPIALLTFLGWLTFVPRRARPAATIGLVVGMAALALYAVAGAIYPYYH